MSKTIRCQGCGAMLQIEDELRVGYAKSLDLTYCQSCYRLMHYGESITHFHPEDLPSLPENSIIVMVSSVLHLDMLFSYPVYRYQPDAKYVYIINQLDLLPRSTNLDLLIDQITLKAKKSQIPYIDIILMSSKSKDDILHLKQYLQSHKNPNIYLLGVQNSGKTTIYKALTDDDKALAFKKAGLTQEALSKPFGKRQTIYDMPGLYQEGYLHQMLPYSVYKRLIPDHEINPKIYQMKNNQTIFIEGLVALTFSGSDTNAVFYLDDMVIMHKTNPSRIKDLLDNKEKNFKVFAEAYEEKNFKIPLGKYQITFADMGFVHIQGPLTVKMMVPKGMHISLSEALFQ
ncbi:MAG: GTPase [Acholeplasmataceae bacterium]|nr:GTPase [Acholeplasmataceae bacterium]